MGWDPIGVKKLVAIFRDATGVIVPETEEVLQLLGERLTQGGVVLEGVGDLVEDVDAFVDQLEGVPEGLKQALKEAVKLGNVSHRVLLRVGNTLRGLFPLTVESTPSHADSVLGALLRAPDGSPGSLKWTITPRAIPD